MEASSTPVVAQGLAGNLRSRYRRGTAVVLAVLLALVLVAVWLFVFGPLAHREPQLSRPVLIQAVNRDNARQQYVAAERLIKAQHGYPAPFYQRLLAEVYASAGSRQQALMIFRSVANEHQLTSADAETAASVARAAGDRQLAASYYRQAIALLKADKTDPVQGADERYLQAQLAAVEAKQ